MMRRRDLLASAAVLPFPGVVFAHAARSRISVPDNDFMTSLPGLMEVAGVPGISIGLVARGQAIWQAHVGAAEKDGAAVGPTTIWKAASLSKQVSCYAALRLADTVALDLDRPLAFYLGADALPDAAARRITARHVLTHSSGLPNWRQTREIVPAFVPGSQFRYSGEGYFLLARCIEKITGVGFEAYMQDAVFEPLGMNSSTFLWRPDLPERLVPGHHWEGTPWDDASWRDRLHARIAAGGLPAAQWTLDRVAAAMAPVSGADKGVSPLPGAIYYPNPAMSLMTTIADYLRIAARFTTSFGDGLDLSPRLRALAARPLVRVNRAISWGLGWGNEMADGMSCLFQNGSLAGAYSSFCLLHPPSETGMVVFTNHINGPRVIDRILRAATGREHPVFLWA